MIASLSSSFRRCFSTDLVVCTERVSFRDPLIDPARELLIELEAVPGTELRVMAGLWVGIGCELGWSHDDMVVLCEDDVREEMTWLEGTSCVDDADDEAPEAMEMDDEETGDPLRSLSEGKVKVAPSIRSNSGSSIKILP